MANGIRPEQGANANIWLRNVWNRLFDRQNGQQEIPTCKNLIKSKTKWRPPEPSTDLRVKSFKRHTLFPITDGKRCANLSCIEEKRPKKWKMLNTFHSFRNLHSNMVRHVRVRYADRVPSSTHMDYGVRVANNSLHIKCANKKMCVSEYNLMWLFFPLGTLVVISFCFFSFASLLLVSRIFCF